MKRSSGLLCGLLMSCLAFRGSSEELSVIQSPSSLTVNVGDSAQISCCWNIFRYKVKVSWFMNEARLSYTKQEIQELKKQNCSTLHLTNILKNYTGCFVCKVTQDMPFLAQMRTNGTTLFVNDRQPDETTTVDSVSTATVSFPPQTTPTSISEILRTSDPILPSSLATTSISSKELCVDQSPSSIAVNEGESAEISCCWKHFRHKVKVVWYINKARLSDARQKSLKRNQNCSTLQLTNILKNDTGHYVCEVTQDIPVLVQVTCAGTDLTVNVREPDKTTTDYDHMVTIKPVIKGTSNLRDIVIIYIFRSLPFICLLSAFFYLKRHKKPITLLKPALTGQGPDEDQVREARRKYTEEVKEDEIICEQEEGRIKPEKPNATSGTEEQKGTF